jgi:hypothetical protein
MITGTLRSRVAFRGFKVNIQELNLPSDFYALFKGQALQYPVSQKNKKIHFWQFPAITEKAAYEIHAQTQKSLNCRDGVLSIYLGMPWATFIDQQLLPKETIASLKTILNYARDELAHRNIKLDIHTVCQHIFWEKCINVWRELGISAVWLSHMPSGDRQDLSFKVHPWALYPVNVLDTSRNYGLDLQKKIKDKKYLASFIGAHMPHYVSDIRLQLKQFENETDFSIKITDEWHFNRTVYQDQVEGLIFQATDSIDYSVLSYNSILTNSKFALCPAGAGRNTIRFWEALAVGTVPVLFDELFEFPFGGSLSEIPWKEILVTVDSSNIDKLPDLLRSYSDEKILEMQHLGKMAWLLVNCQTCF